MTPIADSITFASLIAAVQAGNWDYVDEHVRFFAQRPEVLAWTMNVGFSHRSEVMRDFACSLWEKSEQPFLAGAEKRLTNFVASDPGKYVRFRAAFALFRRGDRSVPVVNCVREAAADPEVAATAKQYLQEATLE